MKTKHNTATTTTTTMDASELDSQQSLEMPTSGEDSRSEQDEEEEEIGYSSSSRNLSEGDDSSRIDAVLDNDSDVDRALGREISRKQEEDDNDDDAATDSDDAEIGSSSPEAINTESKSLEQNQLNSPARESLLSVLGINGDHHSALLHQHHQPNPFSSIEIWEPFPLDPPPTFEDKKARFEAIQEFVELAIARKLLEQGPNDDPNEKKDVEKDEKPQPETKTKDAEKIQKTTNLKPPPAASVPKNPPLDEIEEEDGDEDEDGDQDEEEYDSGQKKATKTSEDEDMDYAVPMEVKSGEDQNHHKRKRKSAESPTIEGSDANARFRGYQEDQWHKQFQDLVDFKNKTGHCCVPHDYKDNPALARWVSLFEFICQYILNATVSLTNNSFVSHKQVKRQRYQYKLRQEGKNSTMIESRMEALTNLGFVWDSHTAGWEERLYELKMFKVVYGHCNVPSTFPANPQLTTWVKCQRRQYKFLFSGKRSNLTPERIAKLNEIGFNWNVRGYNRILPYRL